jgi:hypothetical protein
MHTLPGVFFVFSFDGRFARRPIGGLVPGNYRHRQGRNLPVHPFAG